MNIDTITAELRFFLDKEGRLKQYPSRQRQKMAALCYLASKFTPDVKYTEAEVNELLRQWHTFEDWAMLRRELYDKWFLGREANGSLYWLEETTPGMTDSARNQA